MTEDARRVPLHPIAQRAIETDESLVDLVREFYSPDGPLVAAGLQIRPQQAEMAIDIASAMERDRPPEKLLGRGWTLHQAPTGTGKSLSYLLPGILAALRSEAKAGAGDSNAPARPFVVSTANIALQEQIVTKDVPMIAGLLGVEVRAMVRKGVANYLCRKSGDNADPNDPDINRLLAWAEYSTGDRESLEWDAGPAWAAVSRGSDDCLGRSCPHYALTSERPCFWRLSQRSAARAHVLVLNHALLARVKVEDPVLLAVDEAHVLEGSLRNAGAFTIRRNPGRALADLAAEFIGADRAIDYIETPAMSVYREAVSSAFPDGGRAGDAVRLRVGWATANDRPDPGRHIEVIGKARAALEGEATSLGAAPSPYGWQGAQGDEVSGRAARALNRLERLIERLRIVVSGGGVADGIEHVVYVEVTSGRKGDEFVDIQVSPIDVAVQFAGLVRGYPRAALTSATLHDDLPFDAALGIVPRGTPDGVGAEDPFVVRKRLTSPFDLPNQGLLVVPTGPPPTERGWAAWAREAVVRAVEGSQGRALVLASTWRQAQDYAAALREQQGAGGASYPILVQGEQGRAVLRQRFRDEVDSVLVGTRSFFEGLDVQGESCSCVIIDRIPFARPDDLVEDAVATAIGQRAGGSPYLLRTVPEAAMVLAQGAGRLIRSSTDRGVLVLLDGRVLQSGPSWRRLAAALPPFRRSGSLRDVRAFLAGEALVGVVQAKQRRMVLSDWED